MSSEICEIRCITIRVKIRYADLHLHITSGPPFFPWHRPPFNLYEFLGVRTTLWTYGLNIFLIYINFCYNTRWHFILKNRWKVNTYILYWKTLSESWYIGSNLVINLNIWHKFNTSKTTPTNLYAWRLITYYVNNRMSHVK